MKRGLVKAYMILTIIAESIGIITGAVGVLKLGFIGVIAALFILGIGGVSIWFTTWPYLAILELYDITGSHGSDISALITTAKINKAKETNENDKTPSYIHLITCPKCGKKTKSDNKTCPFCGESFLKDENKNADE